MIKLSIVYHSTQNTARRIWNPRNLPVFAKTPPETNIPAAFIQYYDARQARMMSFISSMCFIMSLHRAI